MSRPDTFRKRRHPKSTASWSWRVSLTRPPPTPGAKSCDGRGSLLGRHNEKTHLGNADGRERKDLLHVVFASIGAGRHYLEKECGAFDGIGSRITRHRQQR